MMVWHRNSIGILSQRFFFTLLVFSSILVFMGCVDTASSDDLKTCIENTCIPMFFVLFIVTLKVSFSRCALNFLINVFTSNCDQISEYEFVMKTRA